MKVNFARIFGYGLPVVAALAVFSFGFLVPSAAQAAETSIIGRISEQIPCFRNGSCSSLDAILQVFGVIAQWLLGIAGSVMVLMFVWGGAEWVFSRGESGMVKSGKDKMTNAVIGIVLMFSALAIVRSIQSGLLGETDSTGATRCVVDSDCSGNQECLAGICRTRAAGQNGSTGANSCSFRDDCTANGTTPWRDCGVDKQCTDYCTKVGGACKAECLTTESDGGSGPYVCQTATQTCCIPR